MEWVPDLKKNIKKYKNPYITPDQPPKAAYMLIKIGVWTWGLGSGPIYPILCATDKDFAFRDFAAQPEDNICSKILRFRTLAESLHKG